MSELDDTLTRLFAQAQASLPADPFLETVILRMQRQRRWRTVQLATGMATGAMLAVALTPYAVSGSIALAALSARWLPAIGNAFASPLGWACALAVTAWGLRRALARG